MQGFFSKPVDNLYAEPLIARWVKNNVQNWREAVVVSKNPGGTKRSVVILFCGGGGNRCNRLLTNIIIG